MTAVYIAVKEIYTLSPDRRRTARAPAAPLTNSTNRRMAEDHGRNVAVIQCSSGLLLNRRSERRRPAATAPVSVPLHPCYRPPRKYLQRCVLIFIDDDIAFFVGFNASGSRLMLSLAGSRPIAQIRQSTFHCDHLPAPASGYHRHFSLRFRDGVGVQLWAFGVHHFDQVSEIIGSKLRSGACLRTNRWFSRRGR